MIMRNGKRGASRQNKAMLRMGQSVIPRPPQIGNYEVVHSSRLRFSTPTSAFDGNITFQNLLDTLLFATSATTAFDLFRFVKIRRIEVWSASQLTPADGDGPLPSTVTVVFQGTTAGIVGDVSIHTDTSMSIEPAYVNARPNRKSLASNYQVSSSAVAFRLTCPINSVVDVELSYKQQFVSPVAAQNATVGATAGDIYLRGLDGVAASTSALPSVLVDYAI